LVAAGFFSPVFSCTIGPAGTLGATGGGAALLGAVRHTSVAESGSQLHGSPTTPDSGGVASGRALASRTSAIHSRIASGSVTVNARCAPSGDHARSPIRAPSGMPRIGCGLACFALRSSSARRCSNKRRAVARFFGLIRRPARRSSGSATSAIDGNVRGVASSNVVRSGASSARGSGSASTKLATALTGRWYATSSANDGAEHIMITIATIDLCMARYITAAAQPPGGRMERTGKD
jgi:hypothetical protein